MNKLPYICLQDYEHALSMFYRGARLASQCKVDQFEAGIKRCKTKINQEIGDKLKSVKNSETAMIIAKLFT